MHKPTRPGAKRSSNRTRIEMPAKRGRGRPRVFNKPSELPSTRIDIAMEAKIEAYLDRCKADDPASVPATKSECVRRLLAAGLRAEGIR